tara:strand:+ start:111825 stop:112553 length:729 start_codon:yes stop_codon:yes gene_type:complete
MRIQTLALACAVAAASTIVVQSQDERVQETKETAPAAAKSEMTMKEQASYGLGVNIGTSLKNQGIGAADLETKLIARGIFDILSDKESALNEDELAAAMTELRRIIKFNLSAPGQEFLAANGKKPGVKTTKTGLQYEIIRSGNGPTPTKADTVTTHYKGQLITGEIFDGSYRGEAPTPDDQPVSFSVGGVIAGWTEALQLMKVGDKWRLFIPYELAYGERGTGRDIGPFATLIFEIELIAIK